MKKLTSSDNRGRKKRNTRKEKSWGGGLQRGVVLVKGKGLPRGVLQGDLIPRRKNTHKGGLREYLHRGSDP